ncbi:MAG: DUF86 domain-containing protein [Acidimicrobiales bacterium]
MVDERRVRRLLQRVTEDLAYLRQRSALGRATLLADTDRLAGLKYVFVTAIEGCLNVAQHICASEGWGPPESNADALRVLGRHGVLDADTAEAMARAVGFRNVLVHGYASVDDQLVIDQLGRLDLLQDFVATVARFVEDGG